MNLLTQIKHKTQKGEEVIMDIGAKVECPAGKFCRTEGTEQPCC